MNCLGRHEFIGTIALTGYRYKAFISYSHRDERWGDWLHRSLETYSPPKNLIGRVTGAGPIPRRLGPVFRDRADLPAAGSLNATIVEALRSSQFLIVIASPNALASKWVSEEIKQFKAFHGSSRVLAVIVDGEPFASDNPNLDDALEAFPQALRFDVTDKGGRAPAEPLAADARKDKDGKAGAITKLAAGLLGVPLDDLVQREAQRRARRWRNLAGASLAGLGVMAGLTLFAVSQRNEAVAQRNEARRMSSEAEGLIEFMITDLRAEVETKVGELRTLETLSDRALAYYERQDKTELDADALGRRARVLHAAGEVRRQRNELGAALDAFRAAAATTEVLLARDPENPDRIFEHAQSVFYVGHVAYQRNDLVEAEAMQLEYYRLAERLVAMDPENEKWRLELAYATNNLGALKHRQNEIEEASVFFAKSAEVRKALLEKNPKNRRLAVDYAKSISWQAYTLINIGDFESAIELLNEEVALYALFKEDLSTDYQLTYISSVAHRRLANAFLFLGDQDKAAKAIKFAHRLSEELLAREMRNSHWLLNAARIEILRAEIFYWREDLAAAKSAAENAAKLSWEVYGETPEKIEAKLAFLISSAIQIEFGSTHSDDIANKIIDILIRKNQIRSDFTLGAYARASSAILCHAVKNTNSQMYGKIQKIVDDFDFGTAINSTKSVPIRFWILRFLFQSGQLENAKDIFYEMIDLNMKHPELVPLSKKLKSQSTNLSGSNCNQ